jgi:membrane protein DedA with SNARE-associated domain
LSDTLAFQIQYGYVILYGCVLAEQIGLPVPAVPILLGVGALAGGGQMSLILALGVVLAASLPPDLAWFELGRRRGPRVLARICAISLEPDWCVRRTEALFIRFGRKLLLVAKFLPGLSAVASPLAGSAGVPRWQFLLLDVTGALVWSGTWLGIGYAFSDALDIVARWVARLGSYALLLAGAALAAYVGIKYAQRRRIFRKLRMERITPEELRRRLDAGDGDLVVIDTRSMLDVQRVPYVIPARYGSTPTRSIGVTPRCRGIGKSCCTAPDPMKPRAPGWRSASSATVSRESDLSSGVWHSGWIRSTRSRRSWPRPGAEGDVARLDRPHCRYLGRSCGSSEGWRAVHGNQ